METSQPRPIVVVEDEPSIRSFMTRILERAGFTTVAYDSADRAVAALSECPVEPGLVLSDIGLPGDLNGIALAAWLDTRTPTPPVVLMSGDAALLKKAHSAPGVGEILAKPFTPDELLAVAARMLAATSDS